MSNSILDTFFEETEELLEALAEGLALMQGGDRDAETVNSVFRAVHSIKGGAGAFKMTELVGFAHHFETVLDAVRSGSLELTPAIMHTLTRSADFLANLVEAARNGDSIEEEVTAGFLAALQVCFGDEEIESVDAWDNFEFSVIPLDFGSSDTAAEPVAMSPVGFSISFQPHVALYANGHEPALLIAALAELGSVTTTLNQDGLADWETFNPTEPRLSWVIELLTEETETTIHEVFEFVQGLCDLKIDTLTTPVQAETGPLPNSGILASLVVTKMKNRRKSFLRMPLRKSRR